MKLTSSDEFSGREGRYYLNGVLETQQQGFYQAGVWDRGQEKRQKGGRGHEDINDWSGKLKNFSWAKTLGVENEGNRECIEKH